MGFRTGHLMGIEVQSQAHRISSLVLGTAFVLSAAACGGGGGGDPTTPSTGSPPPPPSLMVPIQIELTPSGTFDDATIVNGTDSNNIEIQILVESALASEVTMTEGLDPGLPNDYVAITSGFIEIGLPSEAQGVQVIRVSQSVEFETVVAETEQAGEFAFVPFIDTEDGQIEFRVAPIAGAIRFALMDVPEF